jgi:hypothetical protein
VHHPPRRRQHQREGQDPEAQLQDQHPSFFSCLLLPPTSWHDEQQLILPSGGSNNQVRWEAPFPPSSSL